MSFNPNISGVDPISSIGVSPVLVSHPDNPSTNIITMAFNSFTINPPLVYAIL
jgi:hypothetical protein